MGSRTHELVYQPITWSSKRGDPSTALSAPSAGDGGQESRTETAHRTASEPSESTSAETALARFDALRIARTSPYKAVTSPALAIVFEK
jgi:hypothetical protein